MNDANAAAYKYAEGEYVVDRAKTLDDCCLLEKAFLAGATWQREQDAKLCRSLRDSGNPSTWVAETCARTIESKQACTCSLAAARGHRRGGG